MKVYCFDSYVVDKHIKRDHRTHVEFTKKSAIQERKEKIKEGRVCGEIYTR